MKTVKSLFIIMAAMLVVSSVWAQPKKSACKFDSESHIKEQCAKITTALQLTEQQSKQMFEILTKHETQNKAKRAQMAQIMKELSDSRTAQKSEVGALLSPSQKAAFEQMPKHHQVKCQMPRHHDMTNKACVCKSGCKEGCAKECVGSCNKTKAKDCSSCTKDCPKKN